MELNLKNYGAKVTQIEPYMSPHVPRKTYEIIFSVVGARRASGAWTA